MTVQDFEKIYQEHAKKLFRICLVFVKDEEIAAEMVQDIFCSMWERRGTLKIEGNLENYLYRCAKQQYYNYYRNVKTEERYREEYSKSQQKGENTTEDTVLFIQTAKQIDQLVERMPDKRREVYKLSRQEGLTNKEIAQHLLISEKTVKNHLTKSLAYLKVNLKGYG
ncbi:MAG: RNA polymerase sigma-70 factor [Bacteroidota bacterium]